MNDNILKNLMSRVNKLYNEESINKEFIDSILNYINTPTKNTIDLYGINHAVYTSIEQSSWYRKSIFSISIIKNKSTKQYDILSKKILEEKLSDIIKTDVQIVFDEFLILVNISNN